MSEKNDVLILFILVLIAIIGIFLLISSMGFYMPMMGHMIGYGWYNGIIFLVLSAFIVLIIVGAYYLITGFMKGSKSLSNHSKNALEILKERYAKGEITREQYLKMKEELSNESK